MDSVTIGLIVGQVVTFSSVVLATLFQYWRENRNRRWEQEDKANLARDLAATVKTTATVLAGETKAHVEKLTEDIRQNTEISTKAFHEANTVNLKLEKLGLEHNALQAKEAQDDKERNC